MDNTQDLRERAEELLDSALDYDEWKNPIWKDADVINAMLQFAAEVSAEKDKEIKHWQDRYWELERKFEDVNDSAFQDGLRMNVELKDKRIAELQSQVEALKQNAKARIAELEQQVKDLHKQLFDEIDFGKLEDPL